ncbi:MAG: hypothetical protein ABUL60_25315 [Myxococcales bacterium]
MKRKSLFAAVALIASGVVVGTAFAQTTPPPLTPAQRLAALKARQDAAVAAQKARQNTIQPVQPTATPTPTAAPTPVTTPTVTPTATPTAVATTTPTVKPTGAGGAAATTTPAPTGAGGAASASSANPTALPKPPPVIGLDLEELKKTRPDRRKAEFTALQARWGELLRDPRANTELKLHAQRTAYLQRIRALASKANDAKTVQAVDILITKEDTRDADAMNALRSGALPAVAAGAAK